MTRARVLPGSRVIATAGLAVTCATAGAQPWFVPLGGVGRETPVLSASGEIVAVTIESDDLRGVRAFRWDATNGVDLLPLAPCFDGGSRADGISADGRVIVGQSLWVLPNFYADLPFYWSEATGSACLAAPKSFGAARAASADGAVIVGWIGDEFDKEGWAEMLAFRWTEKSGVVSLGVFPDAPPRAQSAALGVSGDGAVVVGWSMAPLSTQLPFRWTANEGMVRLGELPGGALGGAATAVTPDASVIVGWTAFDDGYSAFRWTAGGGIVPIGDLGLTASPPAVVVSADGHTVVGYGGPGVNGDAVIWTPAGGMRNLQAVLEQDFALPVAGWTLHRATGVSADGRTICGWGRNPAGRFSGWIAHLGDPCRADFNTDAVVNSQDFFDYLTAFFAAEPSADFNRDEAVNTADFFGFLEAFFAGC